MRPTETRKDATKRTIHMIGLKRKKMVTAPCNIFIYLFISDAVMSTNVEPVKRKMVRNPCDHPTNYESLRAYVMVRHYRLQECHQEIWKFYERCSHPTTGVTSIFSTCFVQRWDDRSDCTRIYDCFVSLTWTTGVMLRFYLKEYILR